eukprot:gene32680-17695_t
MVFTANFIFEPIAGYTASFKRNAIANSVLFGGGTQACLTLARGCGTLKPKPTEHFLSEKVWNPCRPQDYAISPAYSSLLREARTKFKHWTVRVLFTQEVLAIHNISSEALGCPSLMLSPDPNLGAQIHKNLMALKTKPNLKFLITLPGNRLSTYWVQYHFDLIEK